MLINIFIVITNWLTVIFAPVLVWPVIAFIVISDLVNGRTLDFKSHFLTGENSLWEG